MSEKEIQGYNRVSDYEVADIDEGVKLLGVNADGEVHLFPAGGGNIAHIEVVPELPTEDIKENTLYLVLNQSQEGFDAFIYSEETWERVGSADAAKLAAVLRVTKPVGEIAVGKVWEEGTPLETILRDLFNPVLYPTFDNPSANLSASVGTLLECGTTIEVTLTLTLNKGAIKIDGVKQDNRSGDATGYYLNNGEVQENRTFVVIVNENNKEFTGKIDYAEGAQPKDSTGEDYGEPLPAGSVTSNKLVFKFTDAIWANRSSISTINKQALVDGKSAIIEFPAATEQYPETFDIPAYWTLKSLKVENTLTGEWDDCLGEFAHRDTEHPNASGENIQYTSYYCKLGYDMDPRRIKVEWS